MRLFYKILFSFILFFKLYSEISFAQSVSFELKTSPDANFVFSSVNQYLTGLTSSNAIRLNISSDVQWALYVGTTTDEPGFWDEVSFYSLVGEKPPVSIMQMRARNSGATSQLAGFFELSDIGNPKYIIGSDTPGAIVNCSDVGTNAPGNYLTQPNCYRFDIDLRIIPGLNLRSGLYKLRVDYIIVGYL